jgi:hypothetical protein
VTEGLMGLMALFSLWIVFTLRKHEDEDEDPALRAPPEVEIQIPGADPAVEEVAEDDLEDSRYM